MSMTGRCRFWAAFAVALIFLTLFSAGAHAKHSAGRPNLGFPQGGLRLLTWPHAQNISDSPSVDSQAPSLVVTSAGAPHIVWEEGDELYHSYREDGSWSTPIRVATGEQPALAIGPDDKLHLAFVNEIGVTFNIYYTQYDETTGWSIPREVSNTAGVSDSPDLAVASDGYLHVVWADNTSGVSEIYHGDSQDGAIWSYSPVPYAEGFAPALALGEDAVVHLVWQGLHWDTGKYEVYYSRGNTANWSLPENVSFASETDSAAPHLVVGGDDTMHVVWQEVVGTTSQIRFSSRQEVGWTGVVTLSDSSSGASLPSLALDGWGLLHAAWQDAGFPFSLRHAWTASSQSAWTSPLVIVSSTLSLEDVALDCGPQRSLHAAWVSGSTGEIIYAAHQFYRISLPTVMKGHTGA